MTDADRVFNRVFRGFFRAVRADRFLRVSRSPPFRRASDIWPLASLHVSLRLGWTLPLAEIVVLRRDALTPPAWVSPSRWPLRDDWTSESPVSEPLPLPPTPRCASGIPEHDHLCLREQFALRKRRLRRCLYDAQGHHRRDAELRHARGRGSRREAPAAAPSCAPMPSAH